MEKKDERVFMNEIKAQQMGPGDRVIRRKTKDRALYIVIQGAFFGLDDSYPSTREIYKTGAILGAEQFMKDDYWDFDLICKEENSIIGKFDYKQFCDLKDSQAAAAIKIYNRIIRHMSYELLYKKKNDPDYFSQRMMDTYNDLKLKDEDLFIDLRLGSPKDMQNLFEANQANISIKTAVDKRDKDDGKPKFSVSNNEVLGKKGDVFDRVGDFNSIEDQHDQQMADLPFGVKNKADMVESMPLFLSDHYRQIYMASAQAQTNYGAGASAVTSPNSVKPKKEEKKVEKKGAAKMYKSVWISEKLALQLDKRKKMRGKKQEPAAATAPAAGAPGGAAAKKGKQKNAPVVLDTAELEQIIEDL